jgi:ubiquinone/menaquinone biosynthesis C-methylase UbiE
MSFSKMILAQAPMLKPFAPKFDRVDDVNPDACVAFLDLANAQRDVESWKRFSHDLLQVSDGHRVLDIGCGTGADATALARRVGKTGHVVGIDISRAMIDIARSRAEPLDLSVAFQQADIFDLPFEADSFDATRIDRVLHFLSDPARALREAVRVTAAGGRVVVTEPDWSSLSVTGEDADLTKAVMASSGLTAQTTYTGTDLPAMFENIGVTVTERFECALALDDYTTAAQLFGLEAIAIRAASDIGVAKARAWIRSLRDASKEGRFLGVLSGTVVSGKKRVATA